MAELPKAILWIRGGPRDGETVALSQRDIVLGREPSNDLMVDERCVRADMPAYEPTAAAIG